MQRHPVPSVLHSLFAIGETDRRGNLIDFKVPPVYCDVEEDYKLLKQQVLDGHRTIEEIPFTHLSSKPFLVLRPSALQYKVYVRDYLAQCGLKIEEEVVLKNYLAFSDTSYLLDPSVNFHVNWRIIMRSLHSTGLQDQSTAHVFVFEKDVCTDAVMKAKREIRTHMGELPVLVRCKGLPVIALGIHHLHSPDIDRLGVEYNALMHAVNRTSIFE